MNRPEDDFFVGYERIAPIATRRATRRFVFASVVGSALAAAVFAARQQHPGHGHYEFAIARRFEGRVESIPYPTLLVERPGLADPAQRYSRYPLVGFAKSGADEALEPFEGQRVRLEASLVHRDGLTLLELVEGSVEVLEVPAPNGSHAPAASLAVVVEGEIMDSKCFLGAMKPGQGRSHKACATLCVQSGIPPLFVGVDARGRFVKALAVGLEGQALNAAVLPLIAEPVRIRGWLEERNGLQVLRLDPTAIERVDHFEWI